VQPLRSALQGSSLMSLELNNSSFFSASILTCREMMEADRRAIQDMHIPARVLMEHAAMACVKDLITASPSSLENEVIVLCGKGNNGGDGVVIARLLAGLGVSVSLISLYDIPESPEVLRGVWDSFLSVSSEYAICKDIESLSSRLDAIRTGSCLIDAITGTGYSGRLHGFLESAINEINRIAELKSCFVCSVDVPSGNCSDEDGNSPQGIVAQRTWALQCLKPIHVTPSAENVCGTVAVLDIGIPLKCNSDIFPRKIIGRYQLGKILSRAYPGALNSWKGDKGHVLVVGGSRGMEGAPVLSSIAAFRSGAGLVTLVRPSEKKDIFVPPEVMQQHIVSDAGTFGAFDKGYWGRLLEKKNAVILGPGMGTGDGSVRILEYLLDYSGKNNLPLVLDADAITILAEHPQLLSLLGPFCVLTPHYGEFSRLVRKPVDVVMSKRLDASYEFTRKYSSVLVLKGPYSVISGSEIQYISPYQVPVLGVAGSGDILSGILGAVLARGLSPLEASVASVVLHAESAIEWQHRSGSFGGMLASEVTQYLPEVLTNILQGQKVMRRAE
jgi:ADP-dependent NAD(P)H-hydrate dehydratase / NAD(P)H-hydrate epimerase